MRINTYYTKIDYVEPINYGIITELIITANELHIYAHIIKQFINIINIYIYDANLSLIKSCNYLADFHYLQVFQTIKPDISYITSEHGLLCINLCKVPIELIQKALHINILCSDAMHICNKFNKNMTNLSIQRYIDNVNICNNMPYSLYRIRYKPYIYTNKSEIIMHKMPYACKRLS